MEDSITKIKQAKSPFIKRSGWLFLAKLLPAVTFLIVSILYSRQLSHDLYGIFQMVWMLTNVSVVLLGFGIYSVLLSSGFQATTKLLKENLGKFTGFYLLLFVIVTLLIKSSLSDQSDLLLFLVLSVIIIHTVSYIYEAVLLSLSNEISIFLNNLLYAFLYLVWHLYILYEKFEILYLFIGLTAIGLLRLLIYFVLVKKAILKAESGSITLQHWFFIGLNEVIGVVAKWLDKLLLIYFLAPAEFAIFFNGSIEIPLFGIIISVIGSIMLVEIAKNLTQKEKVIQKFRESFLLLSNIVFPLFWFFFYFGAEVFHVVFNHRYDASIPIFSLAIFIIPVRVTHYASILQCYHKGQIIVMGSLLDILIALALMPVFYFLMGIKGIALAIVISTYIQSVFYLHHSARALQTKIYALLPIKSLVSRFLFFFFLIGIFSYLLQNKNDLETLIYSMLLVSITITLSLYFYFIDHKLLHLNIFRSKAKT